ncbi:MAG: hypothetical protein EOM14_17385 [Clostridia bacterium]|nr:hypothetical protein [Clostridia bacterium]
MRFVKSLMPYRPEVEEESEGDDKFYQAYTKGTFQNRRFDYNYIDKLELRYLKQVVKVAVPIVFAPASTDINAEGLVFLDRLAAVLRNMPDRSFTIACYCSTGAGTADQELAARRAAAIVRYLEENGQVLRDCLLPVGYSETRYLGDIQMAESGQATLLFISGKALNIEEL